MTKYMWIIDGKRIKRIPVNMFRGFEAHVRQHLNTSIDLLADEHIKIHQIVLIFRGHAFAFVSHDHLDYLVTAWVDAWNKSGRF